MPKKVELWKCDVCGTVYESKTLAELCERQKPQPWPPEGPTINATRIIHEGRVVWLTLHRCA